jgi:dipeptidase
MRRAILNVLLSLAVICSLVLAAVPVQAKCSSLAAGRWATKDWSVLFGHNEDDSKCPTLMYVVQRKYHEPGEVIEMWDTGGTIPQVEGWTWAYLWSYMPGFKFSDSYLNEWGVAIASDNAGGSREMPPYDLTDGGIGYWLRRLVPERAKTAREGVLIMGEFVEKLGYTAGARTYIVSDPKETWFFVAIRGKHWCAQRVPDDHVAFVPNYITIRQVRLWDKRNFLACPDLIEHAIDKGWYDPDDGPFDFAKIYNTESTQNSLGNKLRHWGALRLLTGKEYPDMNDLPFSVEPDRRLTVEDIIEVLRCHYEGTEWEWDPDYSPCEYRPGRWIYNLHPHSYALPVGDNPCESIRTICSSGTQESFVMQLRSYMPSFVGNVYWRAQCRPCESVFVPWYSGILEVPYPYSLGKSNSPGAPPEYYDPDAAEDMNSAYWVFDKMTDLVNDDYLERVRVVRDVWDGYEATAFELQDEIERTALKIFHEKRQWRSRPWCLSWDRIKHHHDGCGENEYLARWFLTRYTESLALNAYYKAKNFIDLWLVE